MKWKKVFILFITMSLSVWGDSYHNINDLYGERATGMGGAYAAISDDPSGIIYNPAGLSYAYNNFSSVSANVFSEHEKRYQNVFGKGTDYVRKSRGLNPNFVGLIRGFEKLKVGFGLINSQKNNFDQADQFYFPQTRPNLSRYQIEYLQDNDQLMFGSGFGYPLTTKLSIGGSLFYLYNTERIVAHQTAQGFSDNYTVTKIQDRKKSIGIMPVLGLHYTVNDKIAIGLSIKKRINLGNGIRSVNGLVSGSSYTQYSQTSSYYNTNRFSTQLKNGQVIIDPTETATLPELPEIRVGIAYFKSERLRVAVDLIYTSGNVLNRNRSSVNLSTGSLSLRDSSDPNMYLLPTLNYAFGLEYFVTNNFPIKLGFFTDYANSRRINWSNSAFDLYLMNKGLGYIQMSDKLQYVSLESQPRYENVDIKGYTFGFGYETSTTSVSLIYIYQYGKGNSQVDDSQLPQSMLYRNESFYIVASSFR